MNLLKLQEKNKSHIKYQIVYSKDILEEVVVDVVECYIVFCTIKNGYT